MVYLSVGLAVALAIVALLAFRWRREAASLASASEQRSADLDRTRSELSEAVDGARESERRALDAEQLADSLQIRITGLRDELSAAQAEAADLNTEIEEADRLAEHQSAELASMAIETEELSNQLADALRQAEANRIAAAPVDAETLWRLELARSERTWQYSVAVYPDDPSPFVEGADLLQIAVETEAAALRDEVGAFLTVEWDAELVEAPARAHLVLRVAQELLAKAARLEEPAVLRATNGEGGIVLSIEPTDDGDTIQLDLCEFSEDRFGASGQLAAGTNGDSSVTVNLAS